MKINHLPRQGQEKITAGVFANFRVAVPTSIHVDVHTEVRDVRTVSRICEQIKNVV